MGQHRTTTRHWLAACRVLSSNRWEKNGAWRRGARQGNCAAVCVLVQLGSFQNSVLAMGKKFRRKDKQDIFVQGTFSAFTFYHGENVYPDVLFWEELWIRGSKKCMIWKRLLTVRRGFYAGAGEIAVVTPCGPWCLSVALQEIWPWGVRLRIHVHAHVVALMDVLMFQQRARLTTAQVCCIYMLNCDYAETGLFQHSCIRPRFGNHDNSARSAAGGLSVCAVSLGHVSSHGILLGIVYCKNACGTHTSTCVMFEPQKLAQERALKYRTRSNSPWSFLFPVFECAATVCGHGRGSSMNEIAN